MKYDNAKWVVPLVSFALYECWLYIIYLINYSYKDEMKGFVFGLFLFGFLGIAFLILGYLFIPVTQYFYEKGNRVLTIFVSMVCLLPSLAASCLLFKGNVCGKAFLLFLEILSGFNVPYFLMLILIFKDKSYVSHN